MNLLSSLGHLFVLLCLTRITICFYSNSPCRAQAISKDAPVSCLSPNVDLSVSSIIPVSSTRSGSTSASHLIQAAKVIFSATIATGTVLNIGNRASDASVVSGSADRTYVDSKNGFSIEIPEGFSSMPRKKAGSDSLSTGQPVEILLVAQDFLKGASLSVGRSDVPQLLDDFSVPWAGKPINSIVDVGTANIVSELLILQVILTHKIFETQSRRNVLCMRILYAILQMFIFIIYDVIFFTSTAPRSFWKHIFQNKIRSDSCE